MALINLVVLFLDDLLPLTQDDQEIKNVYVAGNINQYAVVVLGAMRQGYV